jgi:hypothetical protein
MNGFWHRLQHLAKNRWTLNALVFFFCALALHIWNHPRNLEVSITATLPPGAKTTLYHAKYKQLFSDKRSSQRINEHVRQSELRYTVRSWNTVGQLRWDPMEHDGQLSFLRLEVQNQAHQWALLAPDLREHTATQQQIEWLGLSESGALLKSTGVDPYLEWHLPESLQQVPTRIWIHHGITTLWQASLLTLVIALILQGLTLQTRRHGKLWLARRTSEFLGLTCLVISTVQLSNIHVWWTWDLVQQANERDGIRQALPPLIQDAKVLLQRIDPQTPVALSPTWRENYFHYYAAEEYLYPRRLAEQAFLQLSEKGSAVDPQCQPLHEHGAAVLLQCHE